MGTDSSGWVEVKRAPDESWTALMPIDSIVYRSYGMFASLFGIRNQGHYFRPIAARRGMPPDATGLFKSEHDAYGGAVGTTWVLWSELSDLTLPRIPPGDAQATSAPTGCVRA
jgi:hypothetical protein